MDIAHRRPGIEKIFAEIKRINPGKPDHEISCMAKMEWTRRQEAVRKARIK